MRALRTGSGIAQDAFALQAGIDRSFFGKLERGERQPSLALLLRVARGLGIRGAKLVELTEKELDKLKQR